MKKYFVAPLILGLIVFSTYSCKKKKEEVSPAGAMTTTEQVVQASDQKIAGEAINSILDETNNGLSDNSAARIGGLIASSTSATLSANKDTLTLVFNGDNIEGTLTRNGTIKAYLINSANRWYTAGSQWVVDLGNGVTITRKIDNTKLILKGTKTITNVSGGNINSVLNNGTAVTHKVEGNLSISFDNSTSRIWAVSRQRKFEKNTDGTLMVTITGVGSDASYTNISESGINRFGSTFVTTIDSPITLITCSGKLKVVGGTVSHHKMGKDFTVTYGYNNMTSTFTNTCDANAYKINYTNINGQAVEIIKTLGL